MSKRDAKPAATSRTLSNLSGLKKVHREMTREQQAAQEARRQAEAAEKAARPPSDQELLDDALSGVEPLLSDNRAEPSHSAASAEPRQHQIDEQQALESSLSDEIDVEQYLDTDDELSYAAPRVGSDIPRRLRRGDWHIDGQIDLHGLRTDEAREELSRFLDDCGRHSVRCVRIIHGKGLGSANRIPVLKGKVRKWLVQRIDVLAFCQAAVNDGGAGALLVLLSGPKR